MKRMYPTALLTTCLAMLAFQTPTASAQCVGLCADISFGASLSIGTPAPPPRQAQVVVVQPAPAPPPPPPRVVVVRPAPPPPPATTVTITTTAAPPVVHEQTVRFVRPGPRGYGVHARVGGMFTDRIRMGGVQGGFRLRPGMGHFALDLEVGVFGGEDYNGLDRVEVPLTADVRFYFNPRSRFQIYGVAGLGVSFAHAEGFQDGVFRDHDYAYFGGLGGIGAELRISRFFALNADVRGFVRHRVDDGENPEFVDVDSDGRLQSTNTSGGATISLGASLYF